MRVADICTPLTVHIDPAASVRDAARLMRERHVGAIVVVEKQDGQCVPIGMLTDRDVAISVVAAGVDPDAITVRDAMSRPVATCTADQDLFDAIRTMRAHGVRRLPMLDETGGFAGFVAADDVYDALVKELGRLGDVFVREQAREIETRT
jgi:CBS domain-containing protein